MFAVRVLSFEGTWGESVFVAVSVMAVLVFSVFLVACMVFSVFSFMPVVSVMFSTVVVTAWMRCMVMLSAVVVRLVMVHSAWDNVMIMIVEQLAWNAGFSVCIAGMMVMLALESLPPGSFFELAWLAGKAYRMAFAYLAVVFPIFALEFMRDSYGSECRSEKRRSETHTDRTGTKWSRSVELPSSLWLRKREQ
jgi:hypothetical protein